MARRAGIAATAILARVACDAEGAFATCLVPSIRATAAFVLIGFALELARWAVTAHLPRSVKVPARGTAGAESDVSPSAATARANRASFTVLARCLLRAILVLPAGTAGALSTCVFSKLPDRTNHADVVIASGAIGGFAARFTLCARNALCGIRVVLIMTGWALFAMRAA